MSPSTSHRVIISSAVVTLGAITWTEVKQGQMPLPARYVGAGVLFGILDLIAPLIGDDFSATLAIGITIVLVYRGLGANASSTKAPATSKQPAQGQNSNPTAPGSTPQSNPTPGTIAPNGSPSTLSPGG